MNINEQQALALGGVFTGAYAVHRLSQEGEIPTSMLDAMVNSILNTKPESITDVFGGIANVRFGLNMFVQLMDKQPSQLPPNIVRYALASIQLEKKAQNDAAMMDKLGHRIEQLQSKVAYFQDTHHGSVISAIADTYVDTIGSLKQRVQVLGKPEHLSQEKVAEQVRCALLFSIRSAMLWRQKGGHRWHLVFKRGALKQASNSLIRMI